MKQRFNLTAEEGEFVYHHKLLNECCLAVYKGKKPRLKKFLREVDQIREPIIKLAMVATLVRFDAKLVMHKRVQRWAVANAKLMQEANNEMHARKGADGTPYDEKVWREWLARHPHPPHVVA